ncbi:MAG: CinA family nicotinamide mononucleotide deamidase-related protein [Myxococcota bacterium]
MPVVEILSQGDEVVTGQVADTNAAWLATRLTELGFLVVRHTSVGDRMGDLVALFSEVASRCDVALCTGGLGPTEDDLTAEAIAQAFSMPLELDEAALVDLKGKYARFGRPMPAINEKQCWLPRGSLRIDNDWGTAPAFAVSAGRAWMAFMPGVPREMRSIFDERIVPELARRFSLAPDRLITFRTTGVGESNLQEAMGPDWMAGEPGLVVSFRTKLPENHIKLRLAATVSAEREGELVRDLAGRIGRSLFAIEGLTAPIELPGVDPEGGDLVAVLARRLARRGETLACAESCTGGRVASLCTGIPGSSAWFLEGAVTYSNATKVRMLGVSEATLAEHGAVSEPVARQMAEGIRARSGATWGVATTGIAGPDGGSEAKPVGTVHIALAGPNGTEHRLVRFGGDRQRIQALAAASALDLLRRHTLPAGATNTRTTSPT